MNRSLRIGAVLVLTSLGSAWAEDARDKLAGDLLVAMGAERQAATALEQVRKSQEAMLKFARLPAGEEEKSREMQGRVTAVITEEFSWEKWKAEYTHFYAVTFTEQELKDLIAFYESPAGKTYVAKAPEVQAMAQKQVLERMRTVNERVHAIMAEYAPRPAAPAQKPAAEEATGKQESK